MGLFDTLRQIKLFNKLRDAAKDLNIKGDGMGFLARLEKFLDNRKTYLVAVALGIAGYFLSIGKITQDQYNHFQLIAIPAALAALRSAIGNNK